MADNREPPPLFDDDDLRKDDNDLFSSAVQSPVNGQLTPDLSPPSAAAHSIKSNSHSLNSSDRSVKTLSDQSFSDPLQFVESDSIVSSDTRSSGSILADNSFVDLSIVPVEQSNPSLDNFLLSSDTIPIGDRAMLEPSLEEATISVDGEEGHNSGPISLDMTASSMMTSTAITNLPPVPSNMYNISSMAGVEDSSMDLFESCVEDAIGRPFNSVSLTGPQEVSLDDDDDGLFSGGASMGKHQIKSTLVSCDSPASASLPAMCAPLTPPADATPAPAVLSSAPPPTLSPSLPAPAAGFYAPAQTPTMDSAMMPGSPNDGEFIEVLIQEPQKVGDGMGSYMAYKMTTRTNIPYFKKQCWSVTRRFSDYLGLHSKLVEKHLHAGRIIPPAPEKDALNTTKIRLSSTDGNEAAAEFLERRRASLQRYMQRTAALPHLRADPDFREFVELDSELPKATQTSAMSGAGVMRLFNRVGETVNKMAFKMEELDQWFEERVHQVESLEVELRRLHGALEGLSGGRRELAVCSSSLSKAAAVLSSVEEHSALSRALHQLAEATDRTHTVYHAQADADFYILCETTRDYINLIGAVKEVFHERVKVYQNWQYSRTMLAKKRDSKAKLELTARQDKVSVAQQEVQEWENKVEHNQEHFERISASIKKELEQFDIVRVQDFKSMLVRYLEAMVTSQQQVIKVWESFLPEAKAIS